LTEACTTGAFNSLDKVRLRDEPRVVILIDDLDRCFPDQAIRLLESIKLVLAQPGFIFVLGVARRVIEGYLQHRYTADFGITDFKGQLYLDKIVQLPFHLPPSTGRMATFSKSLLSGQPSEVIEGLEPVMPVVAEALGGNPRAIIRFINNILIDTAISSEVTGSDTDELIPVQYFAISRCLENRWPDVFTALVSSDELAAEVARWDRSQFPQHSRGEGDTARVAAALLSERELEKLLLGPQGKDWLENSIFRNASVGFLVAQQRFSKLDAAEITPRWDVFFSYNRSDRDEVVEIVRRLSELGVRAFFDLDIRLFVMKRGGVYCRR
jgi:KAP-like P-loop domain-containing protein